MTPRKLDLLVNVSLGVAFFCQHPFVQGSGSNIARLTDSPTSAVLFQLNPRLVHGLDHPLYIGTGPAAHIRLEHLEVASVHQAKKGNKKLIAARTLLKNAMTVSCNLRTMYPLVQQILNSDGEMPSGKNEDDFFSELAVKVLESKAKGLFVENLSGDDITPPVESLTQGVQATAKKNDQKTKAK